MPSYDFGDDTPTLRDARAGRDEGMEAAELNAGEVWRFYAFDWVCNYLETHETMFCDDLWGLGLEKPPNTMRALGGIISRLARQRAIVETGEYRPRTFGHLAKGPVWKSMLYDEAHAIRLLKEKLDAEVVSD